jgi:penicillin-binding protein 1A
VWVGFDEKKSLGNKETGAKAALPIWMNFMAKALPRQGPPRDFLPIPAETNRILARQANDVSPLLLTQTQTDSDQKATGESTHAFIHPASKRNRDQSNVGMQEPQRP